MRSTGRWCLLFLIGVLLQPSDGIAGSCGKVMPIDEASKDPSFVEFRAAFIQAVEQRDASFLARILDPNIFWHWDPPEDFRGAQGLLKENKPDDPHSPIWQQLSDILRNGGSFHDGFEAPYVSGDTAWQKVPARCRDGCDSAIFGKDVRVHAKPSMSAPIIATLSYDVVKIDHTQWKEDLLEHWTPIFLPSGKLGYVANRFVRGTCDLRARFEKKAGKWMMTVYIAGD